MTFEGKTNAIAIELGKGTTMKRRAGDECIKGVKFVADGAVSGLEGCMEAGVQR